MEASLLLRDAPEAFRTSAFHCAKARGEALGCRGMHLKHLAVLFFMAAMYVRGGGSRLLTDAGFSIAAFHSREHKPIGVAGGGRARC